MSKVKVDAQDVVARATQRAANVTKSVLALARVSSVTPAKLAKALAEDNLNATYLAEFTAEFVKAELAVAIRDAENEE